MRPVTAANASGFIRRRPHCSCDLLSQLEESRLDGCTKAIAYASDGMRNVLMANTARSTEPRPHERAAEVTHALRNIRRLHVCTQVQTKQSAQVLHGARGGRRHEQVAIDPNVVVGDDRASGRLRDEHGLAEVEAHAVPPHPHTRPVM